MDIYKKLLEYEEMYKDGVVSEEEYQKLKKLLILPKMAELGIQDEAEFEESLKKDVFKEAILMLEKEDAASYREAISWLERLGDWGNAAEVIEQCKTDLIELEKQEEVLAAEKVKEETYSKALELLSKNTLATHNEAIKDLETLGDWKDAKEIIDKSRLEIPELEKKEAEAQKKLEEKAKKKKKTKIAIMIGAAFAVILVVLLSMNMNSINSNISGETGSYTLRGLRINYPKDWNKSKDTDSVSFTFRDDKGWRAEEKITYLGESQDDLNTTNHFSSYAKDPLRKGDINITGIDSGKYIVTNQKVKNKDGEVTTYLGCFKIGNSVYDYSYSAYSKEYKDSQPEALLKLIDTANYKKPTFDYYRIGYMESGLVDGRKTSELVDELNLYRVYTNEFEELIDKSEWSITEPKQLKAPETTIVISIDGTTAEFLLDVSKPEKPVDEPADEAADNPDNEKTGFYVDGHINATLDEIMESYQANYDKFATRVVNTIAIGRVDLVLKENSYGGQLSCSRTSNKLTIMFSGTDASGDNETRSDEVPGKIVALCDESSQTEDVACTCVAFGNLLSTLNPEIDPYDAADTIVTALDEGSASIGGISIKTASYSGFTIMTVQ